MIKIVAIGAGRHSALHHGPACQALKSRLELAAVCDKNEEAAKSYCAQFGFKRSYSNYLEMIEKEKPDAIFAVTPVSITRDVVLEIIGLGVPLLMEKPVGANEKEAAEILAAAKKASAKVMVSLNRRFAPAVKGALDWLKENVPGKPPKLFRASILRHDRHDFDFITATAIHPLDIMLSAMGMPEKVSVSSSSKGLAGEDATLATLEFPNGSLGELAIYTDCGILSESYEILGDRYCVRAELFKGMEAHLEGKLAFSESLDPNAPLEVQEGAVSEMEAFIDAVEGKREFSPSIQDGLNFAKAAAKIEQLKKENDARRAK